MNCNKPYSANTLLQQLKCTSNPHSIRRRNSDVNIGAPKQSEPSYPVNWSSKDKPLEKHYNRSKVSEEAAILVSAECKG
jgi:hypothetical protein